MSGASRSLGLSVLSAAACLLSCGTVAKAEFTTISGWNNQLFPSYVVATATLKSSEEAEEDETVLGDPRGLFGIEIESPGDDVTIKVTIVGNDVMEESVFTGTLEEEGEEYTIRPRIRYKYGALVNNKQATPVAVTFKVEIDDEDAEEQTETITLRSINDCPFGLVEGEEFTDLCFMFAAYVNEQHPFVDKLLREALDRGAVDSFTGYQSGDAGEVYRQVFAIWDALSQRDVRYSDITTTAAESESVYCQHVRMLDETINNNQANCVDGSVLFASVLRKVGIEAYLVMVPRHCYLAFALDEKGENIVALETTLIQSAAPDKCPKIESLAELLDEKWLQESSHAVFSAAIAMGTEDLTKNAEKFALEDEADYLLMSVTKARQMGILPIGFKSNTQFTPVSSDSSH
jgi:hypothetical protein